MSELGDKERRFVEDQRRIMTPDLQAVATMMREIKRKDALLAEAAEVLRECPQGGIRVGQARIWWRERVEPLLEKLGERE